MAAEERPPWLVRLTLDHNDAASPLLAHVREHGARHRRRREYVDHRLGADGIGEDVSRDAARREVTRDESGAVRRRGARHRIESEGAPHRAKAAEEVQAQDALAPDGDAGDRIGDDVIGRAQPRCIDDDIAGHRQTEKLFQGGVQVGTASRLAVAQEAYHRGVVAFEKKDAVTHIRREAVDGTDSGEHFLGADIEERLGGGPRVAHEDALRCAGEDEPAAPSVPGRICGHAHTVMALGAPLTRAMPAAQARPKSQVRGNISRDGDDTRVALIGQRQRVIEVAGVKQSARHCRRKSNELADEGAKSPRLKRGNGQGRLDEGEDASEFVLRDTKRARRQVYHEPQPLLLRRRPQCGFHRMYVVS